MAANAMRYFDFTSLGSTFVDIIRVFISIHEMFIFDCFYSVLYSRTL